MPKVVVRDPLGNVIEETHFNASEGTDSDPGQLPGGRAGRDRRARRQNLGHPAMTVVELTFRCDRPDEHPDEQPRTWTAQGQERVMDSLSQIPDARRDRPRRRLPRSATRSAPPTTRKGRST
jgi:hypothetical protein